MEPISQLQLNAPLNTRLAVIVIASLLESLSVLIKLLHAIACVESLRLLINLFAQLKKLRVDSRLMSTSSQIVMNLLLNFLKFYALNQ
jgi:hypothetical protein